MRWKKFWFTSFAILWVNYCIHIYICIDLVILLYTFLVVSFDRYNKRKICLISFNIFSKLLPALTCAKAIGNLQSICLGVHILSSVIFVALCFAWDTIGIVLYYTIIIIKFNDMVSVFLKYFHNVRSVSLLSWAFSCFPFFVSPTYNLNLFLSFLHLLVLFHLFLSYLKG